MYRLFFQKIPVTFKYHSREIRYTLRCCSTQAKSRTKEEPNKNDSTGVRDRLTVHTCI